MPISFEVLDNNSYFKFNLDSINLFNLIRLESSSFKGIYEKAYDILRRHTDDQKNAFFNMIDRALSGPNNARDADTREMLEEWLSRPRRDVAIDLRGVYPCVWITGSGLCPSTNTGSAAHRLPLAAKSIPARGARRRHNRDSWDRLHSSLLDGSVLRHNLAFTFRSE